MGRDIAIGLLLVVAALAVYAPVRDYGFVNYDDPPYVSNNRIVQHGLTRDGAAWAFRATETSNWHPLTWLSLMLDVSVFGVRPGAMHLVNVGLHAACGVLLYLVLRRMTGSAWPSAAVAALFVVHPLHVESVAWISERKDVLSALAGLLVIAAYLRYAARPSFVRYLPVAGLLAAGLLVKPMLVTLPLVLLLLDVWPLGRISWFRASASGATGGLSARAGSRSTGGQAASGTRNEMSGERGGSPYPPRRMKAASSVVGAGTHRAATGLILLEKLPLLALAVASCVITWIAQDRGGAMVSVEKLPLATRLVNVPVAYVEYLARMVWPVDLAVYYPYVLSRPAWQPIAATVLLAAVTALVVWQIRRRPYLAVGWFWYLGTLVPVIGLVQVGEQSMADRYTYIPLIGIFIMVAWGVADVASRWPSRRFVLGPAVVAAILALMVLARGQVAVWADSRTLLEHDLAVAGDNPLALGNLGEVFLAAGQWDDAERTFRKALDLNPRYPVVLNNLGWMRLQRGEPDKAVPFLKDALDTHPNYAIGHNNLGLAFMRLGRLPEAVEQYRAAVRAKPDYAFAHANLGLALLRLKAYDDADAALAEAIQLDPAYARPHNTRGLVRMEQGRPAEAAAEFREAIRLAPRDAAMHANLARALLAEGKLAEAQAEERAAAALEGASGEPQSK